MKARRLVPLFGVLGLALAPSALAARPPVTVALHQRSGLPLSYFNLRVRPGRRSSVGTLELRNITARPITVLLDPLDAVTASTLGSAYSLRGIAIHGPATWTQLPVRRVVLGAHHRVAVHVFVRPARHARPGDFLSGIGVQVRTPTAHPVKRGNLAIASVQRYAVGLELRLPGPRHPLLVIPSAAAARDPAGLSFSISARNAGNSILQNVTGSVLVTRGRRVVARLPVGPGTFVTGTSIKYPVPAPGEHPAEGTVYRVRATLYYRGRVARLDTLVRFGHRQAVRQLAFDPGAPPPSGGKGFPLVPVALGLLAAAVLAAGLWKPILRRRGLVRRPERTLDAMLTSARNRGEPLSMILVNEESSLDSRQDLSALLGARLRASDRLCRIEDGRYVVLAPDTDIETATAIASDLTRQLERSDQAQTAPPRLEVELADVEATAAELLARMTRGRPVPSRPMG